MEGHTGKRAKHGFHKSHVEWHHDGSATVHHEHHEGPHKDVKHAASDLDAVHDSLQDNMGSPEANEQALDSGQHGIPPSAAQAAGIPAGPTPAGV